MFGLFESRRDKELKRINEEAYGLLLMSGLAPDPNDSGMQAEYLVSVSEAYEDGGNVYDAMCSYFIKLAARELVNAKGESINSKVTAVFDTFVEDAAFSERIKVAVT